MVRVMCTATATIIVIVGMLEPRVRQCKAIGGAQGTAVKGPDAAMAVRILDRVNI